MSKLNFEDATVGDTWDLLESISDTAQDKGIDCDGVEELLSRFKKFQRSKPLTPKEVRRCSKLVKEYSGLVDEELWTQVSDRIRQRRHRRALAEKGVKAPRISISEVTKNKLDKLKERLISRSGNRRITYEDVVLFLLEEQSKKKRPKRSKKKV